MYTVTISTLCYLCQMSCDLNLIISCIKSNKGPRGLALMCRCLYWGINSTRLLMLILISQRIHIYHPTPLFITTTNLDIPPFKEVEFNVSTLSVHPIQIYYISNKQYSVCLFLILPGHPFRFTKSL